MVTMIFVLIINTFKSLILQDAPTHLQEIHEETTIIIVDYNESKSKIILPIIDIAQIRVTTLTNDSLLDFLMKPVFLVLYHELKRIETKLFECSLDKC